MEYVKMNSAGVKNPSNVSRIGDFGLNHVVYIQNPSLHVPLESIKYYIHTAQKVGVKLRSSICQVKSVGANQSTTYIEWMAVTKTTTTDDYSCEILVSEWIHVQSLAWSMVRISTSCLGNQCTYTF